jgi:hypothetical protein
MGRKPLNPGTRKHRKEPEGLVVGLIFANWCGHCQALKPTWDEMVTEIMKTPDFKKQKGIVIEIEDADPEKDAKIAKINKNIKGQQLAANGFPTIFKKKGGKVDYYTGGRTIPEMSSWFLGTAHKKEPEEMMTPNILPGIRGGYRIHIGKHSKTSKASRRSKSKSK